MMSGAGFKDYHSAKKQGKKTGVFSDDEDDHYHEMNRRNPDAHNKTNPFGNDGS
jgi:hypothetical protein